MNKLKEKRESRGITQKELSGKMGITLRRYQTYEQGIREPSISFLKKLRDFYECTIDELI